MLTDEFRNTPLSAKDENALNTVTSSKQRLLSLLCSILQTSNLAVSYPQALQAFEWSGNCDASFVKYVEENQASLISHTSSTSNKTLVKTDFPAGSLKYASFYEVHTNASSGFPAKLYVMQMQVEQAEHSGSRTLNFVLSMANIADLAILPSVIDDWCLAFYEAMGTEQVQQRLIDQQDLFWHALDHNLDCVFIKDANGELIYQNRAATSLSASLDEASHALNGGKAEQALVQALEKASADKENSKGLASVDLSDGQQVILQSLIQSFCLAGNKRYTLLTARDVSEREVIINDLLRSNKDLDNFAYIASHDLKAPLNVIKRLVSWVMEDCKAVLPQDSYDDLSLVMSRANRMEQLLHDLLAYSRIGRDYIEPKELNVKEKVQELLSLIDLPMGFSIKCDNSFVLVPEVPFGVVLLNLISNAIKHHDSGNAKIQIKVRRNQKANVITVIDNGPGIPEENTQKIFELFETLKPRDEVEGSGMGLSVVKRLVEHYGGYIKVDANKPRGTKFIVHWPFENIARKVLTQLQ